MPADAIASEVVDSTLAEPVAAAAVLDSAPHDALDVGSKSEVPDFAQWRRAPMRFATCGTFADLCRSPPQRASQPVWTSPKGDEAHRNSPRMPGSLPPNRSLLIAIGMLSLLQALPMPRENSRLDIPMPRVSDIRASLMTPTAYRPIRCSLELRPGRGASNARLVSHKLYRALRHPKKPGLPTPGPGPRPSDHYKKVRSQDRRP